MMRGGWLGLALPLTLLGEPSARAAEPQGKIVVSVVGLENDMGQVMLTLFDKADGYPTEPEKARRAVKQKPKGKQAHIELRNLPHGTYAISVFHDVNGNGKLDTNFLGIPSEPLGASNGATGTFGPPKFEDAKFELRSAQTLQRIKVKRIL